MTGGTVSVTEFLAALPPGRRAAIAALRAVVLKNLPAGYAEVINWGMVCYEVPLAINPKTYNGKPLMYAGLASKKNYMTIHLPMLYRKESALAAFKAGWKAKTLDMGAGCVRFKAVEALDLACIGRAIASIEIREFIEASRR